jgi:hypothetical protein
LRYIQLGGAGMLVHSDVTCRGAAASVVVDLTDEDTACSDCGGDGDWDWPAPAPAPSCSRASSPVRWASAAESPLWASLCDDASASETEEEHEVVARLAAEDWEVVAGLVAPGGKNSRHSGLPRLDATGALAWAAAGSRRGGRRSLRRRMRNRAQV